MKRQKSVNKNVAVTVSHDEYNDVLLNQKCLRHSIRFKVKIIEWGLKKSTKFLCLTLMIKYASKTMTMIN